MKNILCIVAKYAYDALGQLIRVNDPHENATWVYNYDRGGNILSKVKYAYTTGTVGTALETIPYTYGDANWKDKLTAYNGTAITYDAIGNPLNDGNWTYEWTVGRQLKKMSREGQSLTFKYDHNGMRIQKVLEHSWYPETTNYTYHGKLLTHMTVNYTDFDEVEHTDKLHFFYDAQSRPAKVRFNGTIYTYLHNLQGDIVGILDSTGALVVEYKYDAWGKPLSTTGTLKTTLGIHNPFRYRGYVYDEESGLYCLESRCYSPETHRFLNADNAVSVDYALMYVNAFAYCVNSPITYTDEQGAWPRWLETAAKVVSGVAVVATAVAVAVCTAPVAVVAATVGFGAALGGVVGGISNEMSGESYINGWIGGAANGTIQTVGTMVAGPLGTIVGGAAGGFTGSVIIDCLNDRGKKIKKSWRIIMQNALVSAICSALTSVVTAHIQASFDMAQVPGGYNSWRPSEKTIADISKAFGEWMKNIFGVMDDALSYRLSSGTSQ